MNIRFVSFFQGGCPARVGQSQRSVMAQSPSRPFRLPEFFAQTSDTQAEDVAEFEEIVSATHPFPPADPDISGMCFFKNHPNKYPWLGTCEAQHASRDGSVRCWFAKGQSLQWVNSKRIIPHGGTKSTQVKHTMCFRCYMQHQEQEPPHELSPYICWCRWCRTLWSQGTLYSHITREAQVTGNEQTPWSHLLAPTAAAAIIPPWSDPLNPRHQPQASAAASSTTSTPSMAGASGAASAAASSAASAAASSGVPTSQPQAPGAKPKQPPPLASAKALPAAEPKGPPPSTHTIPSPPAPPVYGALADGPGPVASRLLPAGGVAPSEGQARYKAPPSDPQNDAQVSAPLQTVGCTPDLRAGTLNARTSLSDGVPAAPAHVPAHPGINPNLDDGALSSQDGLAHITEQLRLIRLEATEFRIPYTSSC